MRPKANYSMSNSFWDHPIATIEKALDIRKKIEALHETLNAIYGGSPAHSPSVSSPQAVTKPGRIPGSIAGPKSIDRRKGKRSAAARAKMAAAQKARWAKVKAKTSPATPAAPAPEKKKKRKMSPEGKARIIAAQKARWAKKRAAAETKAPAGPAKPAEPAEKAPRKKKTMSPEARARIAAAQRARWAKQKATATA